MAVFSTSAEFANAYSFITHKFVFNVLVTLGISDAFAKFKAKSWIWYYCQFQKRI